MNKMFKVTFAILILCSPSLALAQDTVDELERTCEEMREAKLVPLREAEIEKCKVENNMEPAKCESYYKNYGDATRGAGGKYTERMFNDLAPCVQAREMKHNSRDSSQSTTDLSDTTSDADKAIKELTTTPKEEEATGIINQGSVTPDSRDSILGTGQQEFENPENGRDSTILDTNRDSTSGKSTR